MIRVGLILLLSASVYLLIQAQSINQNPYTVIINSLNKYEVMNECLITGVMSTKVDSINYGAKTNYNVSYYRNESVQIYEFNLEPSIIINLILTNESAMYCENDYCQDAELLKVTSQRFAGLSALMDVNELIRDGSSINYEGFRVINGRACDLISAELIISDDSFINYVIDGEVTNLRTSICIDRFTGLPLMSSITAGITGGEVIIDFIAESVYSKI